MVGLCLRVGRRSTPLRLDDAQVSSGSQSSESHSPNPRSRATGHGRTIGRLVATPAAQRASAARSDRAGRRGWAGGPQHAPLAEMLEVSPMALYRHVADKDDRITTMEAHGCRRSTRASVPSYEGARGHLCDDPIPEGHVVDDGGQDSDHRGCAGVWVVRSIGLEHQWDASRCSSLELPTPAPSCHCRRDAWPHRRPLLADGFTGRMLTLCPTTTADPIFSVKDAVAR